MLRVAVFSFLATSVAAQDVVYVRSSQDENSRTRISGVIVDYNGDEIVVRLAGGRDNKVPADRVLEIQTTWTAPQKNADKLFQEGQFHDAFDQYRQAQSVEERRWVLRKLQAQKVWCLRNLDKQVEACFEFVKLAAADKTGQYFDSIPLAWTTVQPSLLMEQKAQQWLQDESSLAANLIGASWLLSTQRGAATRVLQQLSDNEADAKIAALATVQLWMTKIVTATPDEVDRWQSRAERIPESLRAGAYFTLGRAQAYQKQHEQAAIALMRVPILYPREKQLSARALHLAAGELEKLDRRTEAVGLYREVIDRFPKDPVAAEAQGRLQALTEKKSD